MAIKKRVGKSARAASRGVKKPKKKTEPARKTKQKAKPRPAARKTAPPKKTPPRKKPSPSSPKKLSKKKAAPKKPALLARAPARATRARERAPARPPVKRPAAKRRPAHTPPPRRPRVKAAAPKKSPVKKKHVKWINLSTPRPTGFSKDYGKKKKPAVKDVVVYLSARTGKPVKRATRDMKVLYAHKRPDGELKVLHPFPQKPDDRLRKWVTARLRKQPGNAVLFTQQALAAVVPPKGYKPKKMEKVVRGVLKRRAPREKKWETVHETKLAIPSTKVKQQVVRYTRGTVKPVEPGRVKHEKSEIRAYDRPKFIQPGRVKNLAITGPTIWDSLSPLALDKQLKRLKKWEELFYEYVVVYRDPVTGEKHTIPGRGRHVEGEATTGPPLPPPGGFPGAQLIASKKLEKAAWPIVSQISRSIRLSLAENGLRFSSKFTLKKIADKLERKIDKTDDPRRVAALERALNETEAYKAMMIGTRRQGGEDHTSMAPLNPEREDGRTYRKVPDALRVMLRLTVVPDNQARMKYEKKHKKKPSKRK